MGQIAGTYRWWCSFVTAGEHTSGICGCRIEAVSDSLVSPLSIKHTSCTSSLTSAG